MATARAPRTADHVSRGSSRPTDLALDADLDRIEAAVASLRRDPVLLAGAGTWGHAAGLDPGALERLCVAHFHAPAAELLAQARLARAAELLLATSQPIAAVAAEAGFRGTAAFEAQFRRRTGLTPGEYRELPGARRFEVRLPRSFHHRRTLAYLGRDPMSATERLSGSLWEAAFLLAGKPALLSVEIGARSAACTLVARGRLPARAAVEAHAKVLRRLGLAGDPDPFEARVEADAALAPLVAGRRGVRILLVGELFEGLLWSIVGQQIHLGFARTLMRRLVEATSAPVGNGLYTVPAPEAVAALEPAALLARQFSRRKAEYLLAAARLVASGTLDLEALAAGSATRAERALLAVRGLGPWSVHYLMMRGFGFSDCVPVGDSGLVRGLQRSFELGERPGPRQTLALMEPFRPHRSLATFHFWQSLSEGV